MKFNKLPFTYEQQLDQLIQRGLACADSAEALHYLGHLNYSPLIYSFPCPSHRQPIRQHRGTLTLGGHEGVAQLDRKSVV